MGPPADPVPMDLPGPCGHWSLPLVYCGVSGFANLGSENPVPTGADSVTGFLSGGLTAGGLAR